MKITELMLGDWYKWEAEGKSYFYRVTKETFNEEESIPNFHPIPLTAEILDKNEWKHIKWESHDIVVNEYWVLDNGTTHLEIKRNTLAVWLDYEKDNYGVYADYLLPNPLSVHSMQHALRLCGLNELADSMVI